MRLDYRVVSTDDPQAIKDYLFEKRHRDLNIRVGELEQVIEDMRKPEFVKEVLGVEIEFK